MLKNDVVDMDSQTLIARRYDPVTIELAGQIKDAGHASVEVVDASWDEGIFLKTLLKDQCRSTDDALKDVYAKLRPGDPPSVNDVQAVVDKLNGLIEALRQQ